MSFKLAKTEVKDVPAITELRVVVWKLGHKMKLMVKLSHLDALGLMDHLWKSIAHMAEEIELFNMSVSGMREELGAITELQGKHNIHDVIKGTPLTLTSKPWQKEFMVLSNWVTAVANMLSKVDEDHHQAAGHLLLRKLNGMRSSMGGPTLSPCAMAPLSTSMVIVDDHATIVAHWGDCYKSIVS